MCVCLWLQILFSLLAMSHRLRKSVLIKYYIRYVLATGYGTINFIKCLKGSGATRAILKKYKDQKEEKRTPFL